MGWLCLFCPLFFFEHSVLFVSTREAVFYVVYHHSSIRTLPDSCVMSLESQSVFPPKERGQTALAGGCGACSFQILPAWLKSEVLLNVSLNIFFFFRGSSIVKIMIKTIFSFVPVILGSWQIDTFLGFCFFCFFFALPFYCFYYYYKLCLLLLNTEQICGWRGGCFLFYPQYIVSNGLYATCWLTILC